MERDRRSIAAFLTALFFTPRLLMRISQLLALPLLIVYPERATLNAQTAAAYAHARSAADTTVTVRWNRLVPRLVDENAASRRAARKA
ncbi:MAG: hypothetical protein DMD72_02615, partial [Gemmatimonadetes bacterium]